jgi:hypothetical protein
MLIDSHDFDLRASEAWKLDGIETCRPHNLTWRWKHDAARDRAYAFFEEVVDALLKFDVDDATTPPMRYPPARIEEILHLLDVGTTHTQYGVDLVEDGKVRVLARVTNYALIRARFIENRVADAFGLPFDEVKDLDEARVAIMMLQTGDLQAVKNIYEYVDAVWKK